MRRGGPVRLGRALCAALAAALLAGALGPAVAAAQRRRRRSRNPLEDAERAYMRIDFRATRRHALRALQQGGHDPEQLARIYEFLGISSAALHDQEASREYFERMLAIDPDADLDASVPPRLRDGLLEARGNWAARSERLGLEVTLDRAGGRLIIELTDPLEMARRITLQRRVGGEARYVAYEGEARPRIEIPVPMASNLDRLEYYIFATDEHGNQVVANGTEVEPVVIERHPAVEAPGGGGAEPRAPAPAPGPSVLEEPWFWILTLGVLAAAGGVTAAVLVDQRQQLRLQTGITIGLE